MHVTYLESYPFLPYLTCEMLRCGLAPIAAAEMQNRHRVFTLALRLCNRSQFWLVLIIHSVPFAVLNWRQ